MAIIPLFFVNSVNIYSLDYFISQENNMTDRAKFEAMLEALINEDQETAKAIFHNIVVGKSSEIYKELLESDFEPEEEEEEEEETDSMDDEDDSFGDDEDDSAEDDDAADTFGDEEGDEEEGDLEDRVLDLEDALEELKAEFDQLLAGEENEPEHGDMFGGDEEEGEDEFGGEFGDEEGEDEFGGEMGSDDAEVKEVHHYFHDDEKSQEDEEFNQFMEYVNKVALPKHGDNGVNTKSLIDNMKNDMGGKVIGRSVEETKGGTQGGLLNPTTKPQTGGNVNVPGAKSATKLSAVSKGHGTERKGQGEGGLAGAGTGKPQKANTTHKSLIGGKK